MIIFDIINVHAIETSARTDSVEVYHQVNLISQLCMWLVKSGVEVRNKKNNSSMR